jgi:bifunctional DNase/RNase
MTHDLLQNVVDELGGTIVRIAVTELRDNTFYAQIVLRANGDEHEIDSRPSDAIALAVRVNAPIFAADDVIAESSIEFEGEPPESEETVVDEFREFLEQVRPEDFRTEGGEG